jgi:hypothetical protein
MKFRPAKQNAVEFGQGSIREFDRGVHFFGLQDGFRHIFLSTFFCSMTAKWISAASDSDEMENASYFVCGLSK